MSEIVSAEMVASVWKVVVDVGDTVEEDEPLAILESMKMEIPVLATIAGTVSELFVSPGDIVQAGADIARID